MLDEKRCYGVSSRPGSIPDPAPNSFLTAKKTDAREDGIHAAWQEMDAVYIS